MLRETSLSRMTCTKAGRTDARVSVAPDAAGTLFDLVLVAVRSDQLAAACSQLTGLAGSPAVVFFGTTPGGGRIAELPGAHQFNGGRPCAYLLTDRPGCYAWFTTSPMGASASSWMPSRTRASPRG